jgi:hypothetical protein
MTGEMQRCKGRIKDMSSLKTQLLIASILFPYPKRETNSVFKDTHLAGGLKCLLKRNSLIINSIIFKIKTSPTTGGGLRFYTCEKYTYGYYTHQSFN